MLIQHNIKRFLIVLSMFDKILEYKIFFKNNLIFIIIFLLIQ